jgi:hypothetical protein
MNENFSSKYGCILWNKKYYFNFEVFKVAQTLGEVTPKVWQKTILYPCEASSFPHLKKKHSKKSQNLLILYKPTQNL